MRGSPLFFLRGLSGAIGVVAGVLLYAKVPEPVWLLWGLPFFVLVASAMMLAIAYWLVIRNPRLSCFFAECWVLSGIAITAGVSLTILYITVSGSWFDLRHDKLNAVKGALIGAMSAYFAGAFLDEINTTKGMLSPSGAYSRLLERFATFHCLAQNKYFEACCSDLVTNTDIKGWGFCSRWRRAVICEEFLDSQREDL